MVRLISILVGLGFVGVAAWSLLWGVIAYIGERPQETIEHRFHLHPKDVSFSHEGPFGQV
jgi:ubiquinol-cytochrome c reductase cytochrome c1 subunit